MSPLLQSVILLALAGAASLLALALLVHGLFLGYPAKAVAITLLSRKEQAIVAACADTLFPPFGPIPLSGTEAGAVAYMDRYITRVDRTQRTLIRLLLQAVEHAPWVFGPRPVRFTRLSPAERVTVLRRMSVSRIYFRRVMFLSLRVMLTMAYLANGEVARRIGMVPRIAPFEGEGAAPGATPARDHGRYAQGRAAAPAGKPEIAPPREVLA